MATLGGRAYSTPKNINLKGQGTGRGGILRFEGTNASNPLGTSANGLWVNASNELIFTAQNTSTTLGAAGGGSGSLNAAYNAGASVTIDGGPIILTDSSAGALDMLRLTKSGAGSGDSLEFLHTAAATGNAVYVDMNLATARVGVLIDSGGTARTGADIQFTDDSTGAHSVLDINSSGSGATIGFDFTGSYTGSPAGQALSITFDADDNLDTEVMQVTTGTGDRAIMFDFNFSHTDSGTTSHVFDVDFAGVFDSNFIDVAYAAASTGNTISVVLDNAVAATALHVEGAGARTQPMLELVTTSTGSVDMFDIDVNGAISGDVVDIAIGTVTFTGDALKVDLGATATGSQALVITSGAMTRTTDIISVSDSGTPSGDVMAIAVSGASTGHVFDVDVSAALTGNVFDVAMSSTATGNVINIDMDAAVATTAIRLDAGAGTRTQPLMETIFDGAGTTIGGTLWDIDVSNSGAAASPLFDIDLSGVYTGNIFDVVIGSVAATGDVVSINLGATATAAQAVVIASGNMIRSTALIQIGEGGASTGPTIDINRTAAVEGITFDIDDTAVATGNVFDYATNSASTGTIFNVNMTNAVGAIVHNYTLAGTRTADAIVITDSSAGAVDVFQYTGTSTSSGHIFNIDVGNGIFTGNVFDVVFSTAASTGHVLHADMGTNLAGNAILIDAAGVRTAPLIRIANTATDGGTDDHVISIAQTGLLDSNVLDIVYSSNASTGHAIHVDMGTDLAGNAIKIDAAGTRTAPLIYIANTGADGGTDDHVLFINQTGLLDSNLAQLTFGTAASTGNALSISMDTNVAGMAVYISSAGTGVTGEGSAITVAHTGALVAGADVVSIDTTGSISATSNVLSVTQRTGAGTAGAYAVYISATGDNVEGLKVDDGKVVFDETLEVTGATTLSSTLGVTGAATFTLGAQTSGTARTVTADGLTTGIIAAGTGVVVVTSDDANKILTLPTAVVGNTIWVFAPATGFEVRTPAASGATINGVDSDGTNEAAIPANTTSLFVCTGTDEWILMNWTTLGAVTTAIVPDAA